GSSPWRCEEWSLSGPGGADDRGPDELRRLRQRRPFEAVDCESFGLDRCERRPVAIAVDDEAVQAVRPVLEACELRIIGANVLEEQKSSARPEHAACFPERTRLVVHSAENERRDDGVEGAVLERQILSQCPQHLRQGLV